MVTIYDEEWRIAGEYVFGVAMKDGYVQLDWHDFEMAARDGRPLLSVVVEDEDTVDVLLGKALDVVKERLGDRVKSLIFTLSYSEERSLPMSEITRINKLYVDKMEDSVNLCWGVYKDRALGQARKVMVFAFGE